MSTQIQIASSSALEVGTTPVTSGTDGRVFFQAGGVVQQDSAFFWDNTNKRLGVGATPASTVRLDVRAQGALSTDIAFRVRNSANTRDIINVRGNKTIELIADTPATNGGISIIASAYNEPTINMYDSFGSKKLIIDTPNALICVGGSGNIKIGSLTTTNSYLGLVTPTTNNRFLKLVDAFNNEYLSLGGNTYDGAGGISMTLKTTTNNNTNFINFSGNGTNNKFTISDQANVSIGGSTFGTSSKFVISQFTGTVPTTSPTDAFQQYSADITAGNAAPHFRTENGSVIKLYQNAAVTTTQGVANALTNLGVLASSTIAPTVQSVASAATVTPTFTNDLVKITAQAVALTLAAPTGTAIDGKDLMIRIKDSGSAQTIAWTSGAGGYRAIGITLPTTTVISKTTYVGLIYNSDDSIWDVIGVTTEV